MTLRPVKSYQFVLSKVKPRDAKEYNDNCKGIEITFTKEKCQKVLNHFILNGNLEILKKRVWRKSVKVPDLRRLRKISEISC